MPWKAHSVGRRDPVGKKRTSWNPDRVCLILVLWELLLSLAVLGGTFAGMPESLCWFLDPAHKAFLPGIFAALQLLAVGGILLLASRYASPVLRPTRPFFASIGTLFLLLALGEATGLHLALAGRARALGWVPEDLRFWIVLHLIALLALCFLFHREMGAMWLRFRRETEIIVAGAWIFLVGAAGLKVMSHFFLRAGSYSGLEHIEATLGVFLRMSGASVILYGTLHLALQALPSGLFRRLALDHP